MNFLGLSGLERSVPFKREHWPGLEEREYRISQGHDSAAALIVDGKIVAAAEEERFNRKKHSADFPVNAIQFCLREAGVALGDIDEMAHGFDYLPFRQLYSLDPDSANLYEKVFSTAVLIEQLHRHFPHFPQERVHPVNHHLAHAASAAYTSGWNECLVVVNDAMGEIQSLTVYEFRDGILKKLREISASDSIGILYSLITLHLGFDFNSDEYKIMGLAPYGDPSRFRSFFQNAVELRPTGDIRIPILRLNRSREERENYVATRRYLDEHLIPRRSPEAEISQDHKDVAAALQECLDRTVLHVCGHFGAMTGLRRVALAGGVALNCTANGKLIDSGTFDEVYIQPVAGDDGTALGSALYRASLSQQTRNVRMPVPLLGPAYDYSRITQAINKYSGRVSITDFAALDCRLRGRRKAHRARTRDRLVSRSHGIRPASARQSQHPGRPRTSRDARPHQRHGEDAGSISSLCTGMLCGASVMLVQRTRGHAHAVHDHRRGRTARASAITSCHHSCQRLGALADRLGARQSRFSRFAQGRRQNHGPGDGAEHQF